MPPEDQNEPDDLQSRTLREAEAAKTTDEIANAVRHFKSLIAALENSSESDQSKQSKIQAYESKIDALQNKNS